MTSVIVLYLMIGLLSYWPYVYLWLDQEDVDSGEWYHWGMAWAMWCVSWPYWNVMNAWYWWRANR